MMKIENNMTFKEGAGGNDSSDNMSNDSQRKRHNHTNDDN